jgi:hypothetical protein
VFFGGWWGQGLGDSVLDLQEGVCVLCVFVCVCVSPPEALQRGCAYSFVHYHSPHEPIPSGGPPEGMYTRSFINTPFSSSRGPPEGRFTPPSATRPIGLEGYATPLTPP